MRRLLLIAIAAAVFLTLAGCDETGDELGPTYDYMPLDTGSRWDYEWGLADGDDLSLEVSARDGGDWTVEQTIGDDVENQTWVHTSGGELQVTRPGRQNHRVILKTPISVGTDWTYLDDDGTNWIGRIVDINASFDLPAGSYQDLVMVALHPDYEGWTDYMYKENLWFAEGVGLVRVAIDDDDEDYNSDYLWELGAVQ